MPRPLPGPPGVTGYPFGMVLALEIVLVVTSLLIVLLVLLHRAKGGGLSTLFGGGVQSSLSGSTVVEGYGMSEASPVICTGPLDGTNRPGTIGLPLPETDVKIVDAETGDRVLAVGEVGELAVRGPQVMLGYWKNQSATDLIIKDGWLLTGDLGKRDDDGFFTIVDRKKDVIITSGFNVYPADVEPVLRECPGVEDVAIVGVPDALCGELVKAVVSVKASATFDERHFKAFAAEHLSKHKQPKLIEVIQGDLPRNFLGKVLRKHLRDVVDPVVSDVLAMTTDNSEEVALVKTSNECSNPASQAVPSRES